MIGETDFYVASRAGEVPVMSQCCACMVESANSDLLESGLGCRAGQSAWCPAQHPMFYRAAAGPLAASA